MITFYICSKRSLLKRKGLFDARVVSKGFFLKRKELSDARVVSITKKV